MNLSQKLVVYLIYPLLMLVFIVALASIYFNYNVAFWVCTLGTAGVLFYNSYIWWTKK